MTLTLRKLVDPALHILTVSTPVHLFRLPQGCAVPQPFRVDDAPLISPSFHSVTRTPEETSIFSTLPWNDTSLPPGAVVEGPFQLLRVRGPLDLSMLSKKHRPPDCNTACGLISWSAQTSWRPFPQCLVLRKFPSWLL